MKNSSDIPFFSVVIPTFNRSRIVGEAIESVLGQTYYDFELFVVDDASKDDTCTVIKQFKDERLNLIRRERMGGPSAARNQGVSLSSGRYVAFLDSDDLWLPEKLEVQKEYFLENPDMKVCQTEEIWMRNGKRIHPRAKHKKEGGFFFERAVELCLVSPSAVAMDRNFFLETGGFDETLPAAEDYDLWLRILCQNPIGLIKDPLVIKRAGNWEQLSFTTTGIDRYRIRALAGIMQSGRVDKNQYKAAWKAMKEKVEIYVSGCEKRGKHDEARRFEELFSTLPRPEDYF